MPRGEDEVCVIERHLAALSGRSRPEVLKELEGGGGHFAALRRLTWASPHALTRLLRALEAAGRVARSRALAGDLVPTPSPTRDDGRYYSRCPRRHINCPLSHSGRRSRPPQPDQTVL
jgi:hypothetical protein